jgi:hypothetical protein
MDSALIAAAIAAVTSLAVSCLSIYASRRQQHEERQLEARAELSRHRKPLLEAAQDLGARIDNIQHNEFDVYFQSPDRREVAIKSTLYRFARYFATLEILRSQLTFLEFENADETKAVAKCIVAVESALTSDRYRKFMLWREEQRAIGEATLLREEDGSIRCLGFATFVAEFDGRVATWLSRFQAELEEPGAARRSKRLASVQGHLQRLVRQLDEEGRYADASGAPRWLTAEPGQKLAS